MSSLPPTMHALHQTSLATPLTLRTLPTPTPTPGSAIIRILSANILSYSREIYNGARSYTYSTPLIPGASAIGRVAAPGPDTTSLRQGQLVLIDCFVRARDEPTAAFLMGIHGGATPASQSLMAGEWRDATYAEYAKIPLENCIPLNEDALMGKLGYSLEDLAQISRHLVPYGGLRDIDLKVGETVIVAPATGAFGGAAVHVALSLGARVIAMGRDVQKLEALKQKIVASGVNQNMLETVPMTGDLQKDMKALKAFGDVDAFFDISPPAAEGSTHIKAAILALRHGGRVSLMGGIKGDVGIPHHWVMHFNIKIQGKWMYERNDVLDLLKMAERGNLRLGEKAGMKNKVTFALEDWEKAFDTAAENAGYGDMVVFKP